MLLFVDGVIFGTWAALIPSFQQKFGLSAVKLSWVLFGVALGALISMPFTGHVVARQGSRTMAFWAALGFCVALPLLGFAPTYPVLMAAAIFFGMAKGALDVSINAQAITVENAIKRPIMSSFQGFWSLGGLGAAFVLSLILNHGVGVSFLMLAIAFFLSLLVLSSLGRLLPEDPIRQIASPGFSWPDSRLLRLGGLAFLALFSEGVLLDWSAVYARNVARVSVAIAPLAFASFALCMAAGRFLGDLLIARLGPIEVLRFGAILIALGVGTPVVIPQWPAVLIGFAIVGFGIANLVPILFGVAGRAHKSGAGPGLATVTTLGWLGFLSGPPVIGFMAALAGLPSAFIIVVVFATIIATFGVSIVRAAQKII
jgi:MFS family permease